VQVVGEDGQPSGWRGELLLGGAWLSPGYHGDRELTGERYAGHGGQRYLRTRDLLRRLPDGQWLHEGRADAQVKIRGIRVEPAEVEAVLGQCPGVAEAAVIAVENEPGEWSLAAYPAGEAVPDEAGLRAFLRARLPESLVPGSFTPLPRLPRLPNGKLDRRALPAPGRAPAPAAVPPRTEIERRLAELWCGVLKCEQVGIHDDFFALGGHSLLATRLIARVRDAFGLEVPLIALFEAPTIAAFAEAVERTGTRPADPALPALRRQPRPARGAAGA